ncbi:phosphopantetheine-binding protein [uncultured Paracoccus sp.]|uniref:phosphopantetheine-binding protein n=1 Tax=uncultured Paracoccus sp. TaxID=189685 RepID=UPI0026305129|nr:phosphopantetheine-binding protein [uncultured Paracoccus sp.]
MTNDTRSRIRSIIAEQAMLEPDQVTDASTPGELGIDSLGLVETIFAIEEEFDITVPFNANEPEKSDFDITNMGTIIAAVDRLISEKAA